MYVRSTLNINKQDILWGAYLQKAYLQSTEAGNYVTTCVLRLHTNKSKLPKTSQHSGYKIVLLVVCHGLVNLNCYIYITGKLVTTHNNIYRIQISSILTMVWPIIII